MKPYKCYIADRTEEGSCNNCQTRVWEKVVCIRLNTVMFRLCKDCAKDVRNLLSKAYRRLK